VEKNAIENIGSLRCEMLKRGVLHGDFVPHNIFLGKDSLIVLDCFPPADCPRKLDYLTPDMEFINYLYSLLTSTPIYQWLNMKKIFSFIEYFRDPPLQRNIPYRALVKNCGYAFIDYARMKLKYPGGFRSTFKGLLLCFFLLGIMGFEKYRRD